MFLLGSNFEVEPIVSLAIVLWAVVIVQILCYHSLLRLAGQSIHLLQRLSDMPKKDRVDASYDFVFLSTGYCRRIYEGNTRPFKTIRSILNELDEDPNYLLGSISSEGNRIPKMVSGDGKTLATRFPEDKERIRTVFSSISSILKRNDSEAESDGIVLEGSIGWNSLFRVISELETREKAHCAFHGVTDITTFRSNDPKIKFVMISIDTESG